MSATGSAGMMCEMTNVTTSSPNRVGTNQSSRCRTRTASLNGCPLSGGLGGASRSPQLDHAVTCVISLRVIDPAYFLSIPDRTEPDALEVLRPRAVVLRVVDPHPAGVLVHDPRRVLIRL